MDAPSSGVSAAGRSRAECCTTVPDSIANVQARISSPWWIIVAHGRSAGVGVGGGGFGGLGSGASGGAASDATCVSSCCVANRASLSLSVDSCSCSVTASGELRSCLGRTGPQTKSRSNTNATRSAVLTVDMSPARAAGTYSRSAGKVPRSLMMPPGHGQVAAKPLGWTRVWGTSLSGVWVLKVVAGLVGCRRTWTMLVSFGTAGQVLRQSGPRQGTNVCAHTHMGMEQFDHRLIPPFL